MLKEQPRLDGSLPPARKVFHDWLAASDDWLQLYRRIRMDGGAACVAQERLLELETRVEEAADAFERVRRGSG